MSTTDLKKTLHHLIDSVNDEETLQKIYSMVRGSIGDAQPTELTQVQEAELEESYQQSLDSSQWISHEEIQKKYAPWRLANTN